VTAREVLIELDATIDAAERHRPAAELAVAEPEVARLGARRRRSARRSCRRTAPTRARSTSLRTIVANSPALSERSTSQSECASINGARSRLCRATLPKDRAIVQAERSAPDSLL
jgi:hypothetical protein